MDLSEIIKDPQKANEAAPEEIPILLASLASIQSLLTSRLLAVGIPATAGTAEKEDRLLEIEEAAERLSMSKSSLYKNKYPFKVHMGSSVKFSSNGIDKYIAQRRGRQ